MRNTYLDNDSWVPFEGTLLSTVVSATPPCPISNMQGKRITRRKNERLFPKEMIAFAQRADVAIICALEEEATAVAQEVSACCQAIFVTGIDNHNQVAYRYTTITNAKKEPLTLLLLCQSYPGPIATALDVRALLQSIQPRFMAMCGICAGDKQYLHLGDLVVAEYAYHYQVGKIEQGPQGAPVHRPEWVTYGPAKQILHMVRSFDGWKGLVGKVQRPDQEPGLPRRVVAAMASGMGVHSADPFSALQQHNHKTWALDEERSLILEHYLYNLDPSPPLVESHSDLPPHSLRWKNYSSQLTRDSLLPQHQVLDEYTMPPISTSAANAHARSLLPQLPVARSDTDRGRRGSTCDFGLLSFLGVIRRVEAKFCNKRSHAISASSTPVCTRTHADGIPTPSCE